MAKERTPITKPNYGNLWPNVFTGADGELKNEVAGNANIGGVQSRAIVTSTSEDKKNWTVKFYEFKNKTGYALAAKPFAVMAVERTAEERDVKNILNAEGHKHIPSYRGEMLVDPKAIKNTKGTEFEGQTEEVTQNWAIWNHYSQERGDSKSMAIDTVGNTGEKRVSGSRIDF